MPDNTTTTTTTAAAAGGGAADAGISTSDELMKEKDTAQLGVMNAGLHQEQHKWVVVMLMMYRVTQLKWGQLTTFDGNIWMHR